MRIYVHDSTSYIGRAITAAAQVCCCVALPKARLFLTSVVRWLQAQSIPLLAEPDAVDTDPGNSGGNEDEWGATPAFFDLDKSKRQDKAYDVSVYELAGSPYSIAEALDALSRQVCTSKAFQCISTFIPSALNTVAVQDALCSPCTQDLACSDCIATLPLMAYTTSDFAAEGCQEREGIHSDHIPSDLGQNQLTPTINNIISLEHSTHRSQSARCKCSTGPSCCCHVSITTLYQHRHNRDCRLRRRGTSSPATR